MTISREEIKTALGQLPLLELVELIKELEEDWGVSAAAPVAVATAPAAAAAEAEEEQTEFNVVLSAFGDNKVAVIKAVRGITSMGLKEAKELVENAPAVIKEGVNKAEAEDFQKALQDAGATVEVK